MVTTERASKKSRNQHTARPSRGVRPMTTIASRSEKPGKRATATKPTAQNIGSAFIDLVRNDENIERVWVRNTNDCVEIWVLTKPITHEQRLQLRSLTGQLREQFPKAAIVLHIENAGLYEVEHSEFVFEVPHGALALTLR